MLGRCVAGARGVGFGTMNRWTLRASRTFAGGVAAMLALAPAAMGQAEGPKPPQIAEMGSPPVIVYYLVGFVGIAICVALAAFPGRRSFED